MCIVQKNAFQVGLQNYCMNISSIICGLQKLKDVLGVVFPLVYGLIDNFSLSASDFKI